MICADTSFLLSFYGDDMNSETARWHQSASGLPIHAHALNDFEFANALRALVFRRKITASHLRQWLAEYEADKQAGAVRLALVDANAVLRRAEIISAAMTESHGHRAFDILLVAAAKILGATEFWSFDGRQRALADAEGLAVGP